MINIDKDSIRQEVEERTHQLNVTEEWLTPAGNQRSAPMYEVLLENKFLKKTKHLKKRSVKEIKVAAERQLAKWNEQEIRKRIKNAKKNAKEKAEAEWIELKENLNDELQELDNILNSTIDFDDKIDWDELLDHTEYHEFKFDEYEPVEPDKPLKPKPPQKDFWDKIFPFLWNKKAEEYKEEINTWNKKCSQLDNGFKKELKAWKKRKENARNRWKNKKEVFEQAKKRRNDTVLNFKMRYENGEANAILEYFESVFERSVYPESVELEYDLTYESETHTLLIDLSLPNKDHLPGEKDYKLKKSTGEITPKMMREKERDALYDSVIQQIIIRTFHEIFEADYINSVKQVVINGWVTYLDKATGNDKTSCIISVSADRKEFEGFNLARLDPAECIKSLKGVVAGSLSNIAPVKPILQLDKNDRRFVESEEILADINSTTNLAEIDWQEFEHLVRELFEQMFSDDSSEVKVTQASSDGGIDAIAFDSDPIRGGKFVIQAKRYTKVVPVSAVRDLYGSMISEGATKGILVTTAHFGRDTRTFVKNKPITLIDGANLVYLLEEHGHKVRIDVKAARTKINKES